MKTLLLTVIYEGKTHNAILPESCNGIVFGKLSDGQVIEDCIDLSSLGSKLKGDVYVESLDFRTIESDEVKEIAADLNTALFEEFISSIEKELTEDMVNCSEMQLKQIKNAQLKLFCEYGIKEFSENKALQLAYNHEKKLKEYMEEKMTSTLKVLDSELEMIKVLILQNGLTLIED